MLEVWAGDGAQALVLELGTGARIGASIGVGCWSGAVFELGLVAGVV